MSESAKKLAQVARLADVISNLSLPPEEERLLLHIADWQIVFSTVVILHENANQVSYISAGKRIGVSAETVFEIIKSFIFRQFLELVSPTSWPQVAVYQLNQRMFPII